jgi:hypothetical protein
MEVQFGQPIAPAPSEQKQEQRYDTPMSVGKQRLVILFAAPKPEQLEKEFLCFLPTGGHF